MVNRCMQCSKVRRARPGHGVNSKVLGTVGVPGQLLRACWANCRRHWSWHWGFPADRPGAPGSQGGPSKFSMGSIDAGSWALGQSLTLREVLRTGYGVPGTGLLPIISRRRGAAILD